MNQWEKEFGAKRRTLDRALLAELERQIAKEERAIVPSAVPAIDRDDASRRIARAFGRPSR